MTDKLYFGATTTLNQQPKTPMQISFLKKISTMACLGVALLGLNHRATAQLSVGPGGLAPQTFPAVPLVTEWSTLSVLPSASGSITTGVGLDTAVQTNTATSVSAALSTDATTPVPATGGTAQWNSSGLYLQTRPTGNSYILLMATLRNNTGSNILSITVNYDLAALVAAGTNIVEEVPGHRAFYSLTGGTGTWIRIPEFDSATPSNAGPRMATLSLGSWASSSNLYLLWADDNAAASTGTTHEGAYTIDNFAVKATPGSSPVITTQPQPQSVAPGSPASFTVVAGGASPLVYQWRKNSTNIAGATNSTYTIPSASVSDQGFYSVIVSNGLGTATSTNAFLTVAAVPCSSPVTITAQPASQALNSGSTLSLTVAATGTPPLTYQWYKNGVTIANATNSTYSKAGIVSSDSGLYYAIVSNCAGGVASSNAVVGVSDAPFVAVGLTNAVWRYDQSAADLGTAWREVAYNDTAWPTGRGVLAFENQPLVNALTNTVLNLSNGPTRIITYYFRTHFTVTNTPTSVTLLSSNLIDDGSVVYINGTEVFRINMPAGAVTAATLAPGTIAEGVFINQTIPSSSLVQGDNVLAVEVHQVNAISSDIVFGMSIDVVFPSPSLLVITNQPQSVIVEELKPASFTLGLQGAPGFFQWYKNGVAIPGATQNPLSFASTTTNDTALYYAVVTNSINSVTSAVVSLNVIADTNGPTLVDADGTLGSNKVFVTFSERILATNATNIANYKITNTLGGILTISSAVFTNGTNVILTTTAARSTTANYILIVNGIRDVSPSNNLIATNSMIPISQFATIIDFAANWTFYNNDFGPPYAPPGTNGAWRVLNYDDGNTSAWGAGLAALAFDGNNNLDISVPIRTGLSYGAKTFYFRNKFNFAAAVAGSKLYLRHLVDAGAVFYLNDQEVTRTNMPAGTITEDTFALTEPGSPATSEPIELPISALIPGSNIFFAEVHMSSLDFATDDDVVFAAELMARVQSLLVGPVFITSQPQSRTVGEGSNATFSATVVAASSVQWQRNGINIPGATSASYTVTNVPLSFDGSTFRILATGTNGVALTGSNAVLNVVGDTNPPSLLSIYANEDNSFTLSFNEFMNAAKAQALTNYMVTNASGGMLTVASATLTNGTNVILRFTSYLPNTYSVYVHDLTDASTAGNRMTNSVGTVGFNFFLPITGSWKFNQTGADLGTAWQALTYNDNVAGWSNGIGLFYNETAALPDPKNTRLSLVPYIYTYYFRHQVVLPITANDLIYSLRHVVDDGAVCYVNTNEFYKFNMNSNPLYTDQATANVSDAVSVSFTRTNLLSPGTNMLAVEVHQSGTASSDVVFGLEISASIPSVVTTVSSPVCAPVPPTTPTLRIQHLGTNNVLSWTNPTASTNCISGTAVFNLQRTFALSNAPANIVWTTVSSLSPYTNAVTTNKNAFFRLKY